MNLRDETVARIAEAHGSRTALILAARVIDGEGLLDVAVSLGASTLNIRQTEARAIRAMQPDLFDLLTRAAQEARPGFAWHASVQQQRGAAA